MSVHQDDRAHLDSRRLHVDQKETDAFMLLRPVGAHEAIAAFRILCARGRHFSSRLREAGRLCLPQRSEVTRGRNQRRVQSKPWHHQTSPFTMPGRCCLFQRVRAVLQERRAKIRTPIPPIGLRAPILAISSASTPACWRVSPPPPASLGHVGTPQPFSPRAFRQAVACALSG